MNYKIICRLFVFAMIVSSSITEGFTETSADKKHEGMVLIHSKSQTFTMGMDTSELFKNEPRLGWAFYVGKHPVKFTYDFYMDTKLVTQDDYQALMGNNPSGNITGDLNLPVEQVTWFDAVLYCNARSKRDNLQEVYTYKTLVRKDNHIISMEGLSYDIRKNGYRLPTNAEYEFAERANTNGKYFFATADQDANVIGNDYAWSINLSGFKYEKGGIYTTTVGSKKPNPWGIYDLIGNVFEWCNDWDAPYMSTPEVDPTGQPSGPEGKRMAKGGSYRTDINYHMRIAYHYKWLPETVTGEIGFRCVSTKK